MDLPPSADATALHLPGLDHENLTYRYAGRDFRLTDVGGKVAPDIIGWFLAGNFALDCGCNFDKLFLAHSALKTGDLGLYVIVIRL